MTIKELMLKALERVEDQYFTVGVFSSSGYTDTSDAAILLSDREVMYLIKTALEHEDDPIFTEVFHEVGYVEVSEEDYQDEIDEIVEKRCFPDGKEVYFDEYGEDPFSINYRGELYLESDYVDAWAKLLVDIRDGEVTEDTIDEKIIKIKIDNGDYPI